MLANAGPFRDVVPARWERLHAPLSAMSRSAARRYTYGRQNADAGGALSALRLPKDPDVVGQRGAYGARRASKCRANARALLRVGRARRRRRGRFDACADGRQLKCLTVIDEWTRECLAIDVAAGIRTSRVINVLSRLVSLRGAPKYLRSDNGPEFIAKALLTWKLDQRRSRKLTRSAD
jgi:hypothetical protein